MSEKRTEKQAKQNTNRTFRVSAIPIELLRQN